MKLYLLVSAIIIVISFLLGAVLNGLFSKNKNEISPTVIGFFSLLALLFPGYYYITDFQIYSLSIQNLYIGFTIAVICLILILSVIRYKDVLDAIKNIKKDYKKVIFATGLWIILLIVFFNVQYNFRLDDINFYGEYIPERVFNSKTLFTRYDYQSFYTFISVLMESSKYLYKFYDFGNLLDLGFVINVPGIIGSFLLAFSFADFIKYCKDSFNNKILKVLAFIAIMVMFFGDFWFFAYPHMTVTTRIIPLFLIIKYLNDNIKEHSYKNIVLIMLLSGGLLGTNSSGLFLGVIIVYAYIVYSMINKRSYYLRDAYFISLYYAALVRIEFPLYVKELIILYVILFLLILFKIDLKIEKFLNKVNFGYILLVLVPLSIVVLTYVFHIPTYEYFNTAITSRSFFDNINNFDMVPDLFKVNNIYYLIFNVAFWSILIVALVKNGNFKWFIPSLVLITLVTFFNPFVYMFISTFITNVAFYRISFVFYNPVVILCLISILFKTDDKNQKIIYILFITMLIVGKLGFVDTSRIVSNKEDFNRVYHTSKTDLRVIELLDGIHADSYKAEAIDEEESKNPYIHDEQIRVASQVYGAQLYSRLDSKVYGKFSNELEDRFSYLVIDTDEFEQVFARRIPGYNLPEVDYNKACSLANQKQLDYVVIDAQYNWELQTGLWPCSYQVGEDIGTYRILKLDYSYWDYNVSNGFVEKYDVQE